MGYEDRTKIKAAEYEIYIAKRAAPRTPITLPLQSVITAGGDATWKPVGAYKMGGASLKAPDLSTQLQGGDNQQFGVDATFECPAMETDDAKLTVLEGFRNFPCDILCVEIGTFKYIEYLAFGIVVGANDTLTIKEGNTFPLKATAIAASVSVLRKQGELAEA